MDTTEEIMKRLQSEITKLQRRVAEQKAVIEAKKTIESTLRESEEKYRFIVENAGEAIIIAQDGLIKFYNPKAREILNMADETIIDVPFGDIIHPEDRKMVLGRHYRRINGEEPPSVYPFRIVRKNGEVTWVEINVELIDWQGKPATLSFLNTIQDRMKWQEALQESEERFRAIFETARDCIFIKDKSLRYTHVNPYMAELFDIPVAQMIGRTDSDLFSPEIVQNIQEWDQRVLQGEVIAYEDSKPVRGNDVTFDVKKVPIYNRTREIIGLCGIARNITARKRAELELAHEREKLAVTLRSLGEGVIAADKNSTVLLLNKVAETLTGFTQEEAVGRPLNEVYLLIDEQTRSRYENFADEVMNSVALELNSEKILIDRQGNERLIAQTGAPLKDQESKVIGLVVAFRDITHERKMELELSRAQKLDSLSILAGGIAHNFNNFLTGILGNITLAMMELTPQHKAYKILSDSENAAVTAKSLTQQLLTFSAGGYPIRRVTQIKDLLITTVNFCLTGSNVKCEFGIADDLWCAEVDPAMIDQAITNLVINADQAMPEGGTLTISAENTTIPEGFRLPLKPGRYVIIRVRDQGVGIPESHLAKIFDPYFTTKQKGSGLGLATSYSIIRSHDGYIEVDSHLEKGSTFTVYLPATTRSPENKRDRALAKPGNSQRILIMDDEEIIRKVLKRMLINLGYTVDTSNEGQEMIDMYREAMKTAQPYELVIMDLTVVGGLGGKEAINKLLTVDPNVKAIVSSGYSNDAIMANFSQYGFSSVIPKPYKPEELGEIVSEVLARK